MRAREEIPRFVSRGVVEQLPDLGCRAVDHAEDLGADLEIGPLAPPPLRDLRDRADDRLGRGPHGVGPVGPLEQLPPALGERRDLAGEHREQDVVRVPKW